MPDRPMEESQPGYVPETRLDLTRQRNEYRDKLRALAKILGPPDATHAWDNLINPGALREIVYEGGYEHLWSSG